LKEIWPLFGLILIFQDLAFLKLLMAKFGPFNFFGPGNPGFTRLPAKQTSLVKKISRGLFWQQLTDKAKIAAVKILFPVCQCLVPKN